SPAPCRVTPGGSGSTPPAPGRSDHRYGGTPPRANSPTAVGPPTVTSPISAFTIASGCGVLAATGRKNTFCTVPFVPLTCRVNVALTAEFGVPDSVPLISESPAGSAPLTSVATQPPMQPEVVNAW